STSVAGARAPSGSVLAPRGGQLNRSKRAKRAMSRPTISGQCATRPLSLKPRAASAGPTMAASCAPSAVVRGLLFGRGELASAMKLTLAPSSIAAKTLAWFDAHARTLPWRARPGEAVDPYRVWLSEILLQQTTTAGAAPYYAEFLRRWP